MASLHLSSSRLPEAADGLLASLQRAQAELEQISNKLEQEFAQKYKGQDVNPLSILTRLNKLRRELPAVQEECKQVLAAKQEVVDAARQQLLGNVELLAGLQRLAGIPPGAEGSSEVAAAFHAAVAEHDAKLRVQAYAGDFNREELNQAYVESSLAV